MTVFVVAAVALVVAIIALLLPPLLRPHDAATEDDASLAAYRARLAELEQEHADGARSETALREATDELERELLQTRDSAGAGPPRVSTAQPATAIAVVVAIPLCAALLYGTTGEPQLAGGADGTALSSARVEQLRGMAPADRIDRLENWLDDHPGSARGWGLLAQAYREINAYGDAANAFARARGAGANDAWLIARQAEALLLANDRNFTRGVQRLLDEALARDARNPLALMLAGQAAMVGGDSAAAADYWRRLAEGLPEDSEQRGAIERLVARAEGAGGDADRGGNADRQVKAGARLDVRVSLAQALAGNAAPDASVFVFARRPGGSGGPPLAVARTRVAELPARITLTDADAMTPQASLSQAGQVVVTARVSSSGRALPQSGDLEGRSRPVAVGDSIEVVIDRRLP